jgi:hypothetical protein
MVRAVACADVPKFTVVVGGSFGAGNYGTLFFLNEKEVRLTKKSFQVWLVALYVIGQICFL